jgi:predicted metal-dependent peptidase
MVVIDTSGSLTDAMLGAISRELAGLAKGNAVTVVECDRKIHAVYPFKKPITSLKGRGGTDFKPPLEPEFLRKQKADLVVYFTDGCGEAPDRPPKVPVIWCLTPSGRMPAPWGREIRMEAERRLENRYGTAIFPNNYEEIGTAPASFGTDLVFSGPGEAISVKGLRG